MIGRVAGQAFRGGGGRGLLRPNRIQLGSLSSRMRRFRRRSHGQQCAVASSKPETEAAAGAGPKSQTQLQGIWQVEGSSRRLVVHPVHGMVSSESSGSVSQQETAVEGLPGELQSTGSLLLDRVRGLFIPQGYPHSVTPDYIPYQLVTYLCHVTGWCEASLATSSMLKAVGVGAGVAGATAATAGIKWILKDGIGAAGRLFVGGGLSRYFDEDPRKWRMTGELVSTVGVALEIATSMYPQYFLVLAGSGTLAKSVGKGMGKPAFRVIQQHFSVGNNVGDVAAKEEVWEVLGQLSGLAATVAVLKALESHQSIPTLICTWGVIATSHLWLRYESLRTLRFTGLNQKRACLLATKDVSGKDLPDVETANRGEPMLSAREQSSPPVTIGCSLSEAVSTERDVREVIGLYREEKYVLFWRGGAGYVVLKKNCQDADKLKAIWQAAWLQHNCVVDAGAEELQASLGATAERFPKFIKQAQAIGWNVEDIIIRTPDVYIMESPC